MTEIKIAPSLLSADFGALADAARLCRDAGAQYLHFDIMDGRFVPNLTFGAQAVKALRPVSQAVFDAHLMVMEPQRFVDDFARAGADIITIHAEACTHLQRSLAAIREAGAKAGLALNPATPLNCLDYLLDDLDLLLIMTVNPGFSGQSFLPASWDKIRRARQILDTAGRPIELQVDGGVSAQNAAALAGAGATVLVSGSAIFGHPNGPAAAIKELRDLSGASQPASL